MLRSFLDQPARPAGTLRYHELQGFLFTIASAPELVRPSEWTPIVFGDHEAGYGPDEAEAGVGELMALYSSINEAVVEDRAALLRGVKGTGTLVRGDGTPRDTYSCSIRRPFRRHGLQA